MKKLRSQFANCFPYECELPKSNTNFNAYYLIHLGIRFNENRDRMKIKTNCVNPKTYIENTQAESNSKPYFSTTNEALQFLNVRKV